MKVETQDSLPLAPHEAMLPQIVAEPWIQVDTEDVFLKGMAFDQNDNLLVMAAYAGEIDKSTAGRLNRSILSISPQKKITEIINKQGIRMCNHAVHKDGRIFLSCLTGELLVANPDGSDVQAITTRCNGKPVRLSDLTFDSQGYLYVTDCTGCVGTYSGGIYRWTPDFNEVELIMEGLITPNGIGFSPDEKALWTSCSLSNQFVNIPLDKDRRSIGKATSRYYLSGPAGGDGLRVDVQGNIYVSINFQGRVIVFNRYGIPIANVLMPGRERGELLSTTNVAFRPGTDEVYVTAAAAKGGAWIYRFKGLAEGMPLYSHL